MDFMYDETESFYKKLVNAYNVIDSTNPVYKDSELALISLIMKARWLKEGNMPT